MAKVIIHHEVANENVNDLIATIVLPTTDLPTSQKTTEQIMMNYVFKEHSRKCKITWRIQKMISKKTITKESTKNLMFKGLKEKVHQQNIKIDELQSIIVEMEKRISKIERQNKDTIKTLEEAVTAEKELKDLVSEKAKAENKVIELDNSIDKKYTETVWKRESAKKHYLKNLYEKIPEEIPQQIKFDGPSPTPTLQQHKLTQPELRTQARMIVQIWQNMSQQAGSSKEKIKEITSKTFLTKCFEDLNKEVCHGNITQFITRWNNNHKDILKQELSQN